MNIYAHKYLIYYNHHSIIGHKSTTQDICAYVCIYL